MDLAQLFNQYGSDKDVNGYAQLYHILLGHRRDEPLVIMEIGIGTMIAGVHSSMQGYALAGYSPGGSLRAWRDYFPRARVIGLDVQPDTQLAGEDRIETYLCDSTDPGAVVALMAGSLCDVRPDVIIDDGSHLDRHQLQTLGHFFPHLREGGLYIIEDIYPGSAVSTQPHLVGASCGNAPYFFAGVANNLCVIHKSKIESRRRGY